MALKTFDKNITKQPVLKLFNYYFVLQQLMNKETFRQGNFFN